MSEYSIVVATRNRADVLEKSLGLFMQQSIPPVEIIVVDASDDHDEVRGVFDRQVMQSSCASKSKVLKAKAANLTAQRNQGLAEVTTSIVMYPDDDSYWYPDTAAGLLEVYERDESHAIGGVTAMEVGTSPILAEKDNANPLGRLQTPGLRWWRHRFEAKFVPQPFDIYGDRRIQELAPEIANSDGFQFVTTLGGFRMSFRTEAIRAVGFDEALGAYVGYCQHEDKDASLHILAGGQLLAAAPKARVFHNSYPAKRTKGGFEYGFCQIANYAYILAKVTQPGDPARRVLGRFLRYKTFLYSLRIGRGAYKRDVARGAWAALSEVKALMAAVTPEDARDVYLAASERHIGRLKAEGP